MRMSDSVGGIVHCNCLSAGGAEPGAFLLFPCVMRLRIK